MKFLTSIIILVLLSACASSPKIQLTDLRNRSEAERVIDDRACTRVRGVSSHGNLRYDEGYYYACLEQRGYKVTVGE